MKNRRNLIVAFLLCACLIVGIGYATLTTTLTAGGTASLNDQHMQEVFDSKIKWTNVTSKDDSKVTAEIVDDGDHVEITAEGLDTVGEEITVICEMTNNSSDLTVTFNVKEALDIQGDDEYFLIEVSEPTFTTLAPGQSATVTVCVTLLQSFVPTQELTSVSATFTIGYEVKSVTV